MAEFVALGLNEPTTDTFTYTVTDELGETDTATVTIEVIGVNDAPAAAFDSFTIAAVSVYNGSLLTGATDPDTGDTLSAVADSLTSTKGAAVTINADGTFSYDPTGVADFDALGADESTTDTFSYTIADSNGGTDTKTVTVTVTGENEAPTAGDDAFSDRRRRGSFR